MKETYLDLLAFLKNPVNEKDNNKSTKYRFSTLFRIFLLCAIFSTLVLPFFFIFDYLDWLDLEKYKSKNSLSHLPIIKVVFIYIIAAPVIEEVIFRAPLTLFKKTKVFRSMFYFFSIVFALIHIPNFDLKSTLLIISPFLILPQLFSGLALSFLRVRFGLLWSILLHSIYNLFFFIIFRVFDM